MRVVYLEREKEEAGALREGGGVGGSRVARKFSFRVFAKFSSNLVKIS